MSGRVQSNSLWVAQAAAARAAVVWAAGRAAVKAKARLLATRAVGEVTGSNGCRSRCNRGRMEGC